MMSFLRLRNEYKHFNEEMTFYQHGENFYKRWHKERVNNHVSNFIREQDKETTIKEEPWLEELTKEMANLNKKSFDTKYVSQDKMKKQLKCRRSAICEYSIDERFGFTQFVAKYIFERNIKMYNL